ncbi:MAG: hypothetical protein KA138_14290 [Saprospiraceae bacterium]|nr:hypothetical protein [Saprospiraceae bacterium]
MRQKFLFPILSLAFAGLTIFLGYFVQRSDFQVFITAYAAFFGLYVWVVFYLQSHFSTSQTRYLLWLGIGLRVLLLFSIPNLSDDYARFLWDGHLTVAGIHPFAHTPAYFIENQIFPPGITLELFEKLNSPGYFTIYPPVCQAVFALAVWLFPMSELGGVFVMKLFLLACEIGTIRILEHRRAPTPPIPPIFSNNTSFFGGMGGVGALRCSLLYALNPLIILEICGNGHFEGAMIFFLLAGMLAIQHGKIATGALWWALATASKMLPIMFLPIVWRWLGWRKGLIFNAIFAVACLVLFVPILVMLPNMLDSLDLYFRKFQFNASIYYLVRELGFSKIGWDIGAYSGPALAGLTALGVLIIAWRTKGLSNVELSESSKLSGSLSTYLLFALFLYLSFSATVQPWYICVPLALSLLTHWRFVVVWSGLAALSYSHYEGGGMQENYGLIVLEYALLWGFFLWELRRIIVRKPPQISS